MILQDVCSTHSQMVLSAGSIPIHSELTIWLFNIAMKNHHF